MGGRGRACTIPYTEVRVVFMFNARGETAQLDMSFDDYAELPSISDIKD